MALTTRGKYIVLGNITSESDIVLLLSDRDGVAIKNICMSVLSIYKKKTCKKELSESGIDKDCVVASIDDVCLLLKKKKGAVYNALLRSHSFERADYKNHKVWQLEFSQADDICERGHAISITKQLISNFEDKYRRRPPIKEHSGRNLGIKTSLGDVYSICSHEKEPVYKKTFKIDLRPNGNNKKRTSCVIVASSGNGIIRDEDIKTLYALISTTIYYHIKYSVDVSAYSDDEDLNKTPIYAETILKMTGRINSKENRGILWEQISRIRTTDYDVHSLVTHLSDSEKELFVNNQFRFIESAASISDDAYDADKDMAYPSFYEIKWHPAIFKNILCNKFLFIFPYGVFSEPFPVFSLYLNLRQRMRYMENQMISLTTDELMKMIAPSSSRKGNFQRSFISAICKNADEDFISETKNLKEFDFSRGIAGVARDLYGFKIVFHFSGKTAFRKIDVIFDNYDVLKFCEIKENDDGNTSPTIANPIYFNLKPLS